MDNRKLNWLVWSTGINGFSVFGFAALATIISALFFFSWSGLVVGLSVTGFGFLEVQGHFKLKSGDPDGIRLARLSQKGVFLSLCLYSLFQLTQINPGNSLDLVSPSVREMLMGLYQIDEFMLAELLLITGKMTYAAIMLTSLIYQGGLYWYYGRAAKEVPA